MSESPEVHVMDNPEYVDFHLVLDSGAAEHVVDNVDTPGYEIQESPGSKAGSCFVAANGERIPNRGEVKLDMKAGNVPICSTFQVSKISKPLWSVGKLCDAGYRVEFQKGLATVTHESTGKVVSTFPRQQGLYVGKLQLRCQPAHTSFPRPTRTNQDGAWDRLL